MVWMLVSTALVMLMVPGMGLFYSGISGQRSAALSTMWLSLMVVLVAGLGASLILLHISGFYRPLCRHFHNRVRITPESLLGRAD
jgi:Amt family ammonium transporter